jgi:hypothetical protein
LRHVDGNEIRFLRGGLAQGKKVVICTALFGIIGEQKRPEYKVALAVLFVVGDKGPKEPPFLTKLPGNRPDCPETAWEQGRQEKKKPAQEKRLE